MRLEQTFEMQPEMQQLLLLTNDVKREEQKRMFVLTQLTGIVHEETDEAIRLSTQPSAVSLRKADALERAEFKRLMVQKVIALYSTRIAEIMRKNYPVDSHAKKISAMLSAVSQDIENVLMRKDTTRSTDIDRRMEDLLVKLYHERFLTSQLPGMADLSHFSILREQQRVLVRKLTLKDVEGVGRLYENFQMNPESVFEIAMGMKTKETFLNPFANYEGPTMRKLLLRTDELKDKKTVEQRREKETMEGCVVTNGRTGDEEAILATAIYTKSPWNPSADPEFSQASEEFLEKGVSHGKMNYPEIAGLRESFRKQILVSRSTRLFLIVGNETGAVNLANAHAIRHMSERGDVGDEERCFTYTLAGLAIKCNDKLLETEMAFGQNNQCISWLSKNGYEHTTVSDENEKGGYTDFELVTGRKKTRLSARARWMHFRAIMRDVKNISSNILG